MNAMQRLNKVVKERGPLLAGLDPEFEKILPMWESTKSYEYIEELKEKIRNAIIEAEGNDEDESIIEADFKDSYFTFVMQEFCIEYLEALKDIVGAVKINSAFFESHGMEDLYFEVAAYAKELGYYVIGDVKRADIGNTSRQYAEAFLGMESPFDAITINPYFGTDGVKPFLDMAKENGKGVFVLVKTSNKSSSEIQDLMLKDGKTVYMKVADLVNEWGLYTDPEVTEEYNLVGAIIGATYPQQAEKLREIMPNTFFLVPGYGAQGAKATDITVNFDKTGGGAIVNSSRGIMMAYKSDKWKNTYRQKQWVQAAQTAAKYAKEELTEAIANHIK